MNLYHLIYRPRRRTSMYRRGLLGATAEGTMANIVFFLLNPPFLTGYLLYLGANSVQIGIVLAIPALANTIQIGMAFLMQRLNSRRNLLLVLAGLHRTIWASTGLIPFLFPPSLYMWVYIPLYTVGFLSQSAGSVIWSSLIADMVPPQIRGRYFGIRSMLLSGVGSLALFIGGRIVDRYPGGTGFHILFAIAGVAAVLNTLAFLLYPNLPMERSQETDKLKSFLLPFRNLDFNRAMLFIACWQLLQGLAVPFFSYIMLDLMKISYQWVSIISIVQTVLTMLSSYVWGSLNAKMPTRRLMLWMFPILAASCVLWTGVPIIPSIAALLLIHALLGIGLGGYNLLVFNFTIGDTPKADRPMYVAVFSALTGLTAFAGSSLGGVLFQVANHAPRWFQISGITALTGVVLMMLALLVGPFVFRSGGAPAPFHAAMRRTRAR